MDNMKELITSSQKIKLLYVEDNQQARNSALLFLSEFFAEIIVAVNGEDGLNKFKNNDIDLVITDINMPKMSGLEMVEHIKKINNAISTLIFSAYNEPGFFIDSIKLGIDGYLLKPVDMTQFISIMGKVVQKINLQKKLQKSENFLQQYKEITDKSAIISIIDTSEIITYVNDAFCKISEYTIDELIGSKYNLTAHYLQPKEVNDEIWSTIKDKKQIWQGVTKYVSRSGKTYYLKNTIKPILDTNGEIIEYMALRNDITDIRLAAIEKEKFLTLAKEQADKANLAKSEFLSNMSHELRTPMNAILGFAQILKLDDVLGDEQQDCVYEILKGGNHLLELINDVLDLAKIESGHIDLSFEPVKLSHLVDECFTLIAPVAKKQGISIRYGDMNGYFLRTDRTRLKQVLLNLLSNAIKYNREQGSVELKVSPANDKKMRITITDTGNGIADERLEELFQPFNRLDAEASEIEGTGIGLAITRNLVEMMGGRIGVDSQLNIGSHFWVELPMETLPLAEESLDADENMAESSIIVKEQQNTILYIEDNPANLKLVSRILDSHPRINLIEAHEPELGLELVRAHQPDLILLDINMPRMDGYQILSVLQSDERLKEIPVIAVTANAMPKDIERGKAAGFSDYLIKPLNIEKFIKMLGHYLNQQ